MQGVLDALEQPYTSATGRDPAAHVPAHAWRGGQAVAALCRLLQRGSPPLAGGQCEAPPLALAARLAAAELALLQRHLLRLLTANDGTLLSTGAACSCTARAVGLLECNAEG